MNIAVIGTGYVGTVTGITFAEVCGHDVLFLDIRQDKLDTIRSGKAPFYEPGLNELISKNLSRLKVSTDFSAVKSADMIFLCVGTPSNKDGSVDLSQLFSAVEGLIPHLQDGKFRVVVTKSTVPPTTGEKVIRRLEGVGLTLGKDFGYVSNPEFLREGNAVYDSLHPDRIVVGCKDERTKDVMQQLYSPFQCAKVFTTVETAEMIKYVANALLATKISFANEIARLCAKLNVDVYEVMDAVALDGRINRAFLNAGLGFGGSCFPKDVKGLLSLYGLFSVDAPLLKSVLSVNFTQPLLAVDLCEEKLGGLKNKKVALIGLAFKEDTDDVRETKAYDILKELLARGAQVYAYDPVAVASFTREYPELSARIQFYDSLKETLNASDVIIIQTAWKEIKSLSPSDFKIHQVIIDGRRALDKRLFKDKNMNYFGIGW